MEDGLVLSLRNAMAITNVGLNPCCNGRWSRTYQIRCLMAKNMGLNPCCNGRWSRTNNYKIMINFNNCLNPCCNGRWSRTRPYKTILIISKLKNFTKQILTFLNRKLTIP